MKHEVYKSVKITVPKLQWNVTWNESENSLEMIVEIFSFEINECTERILQIRVTIEFLIKEQTDILQ